MELSSEGNEGLYTSLASAPMFVAKFFAGGVSGVLLQRYCPQEPPRHCGTMWAIIGAISCTSPVCMFLFRPCIEERGKEREGAAQEEVELRGRGELQDEENIVMNGSGHHEPEGVAGQRQRHNWRRKGGHVALKDMDEEGGGIGTERLREVPRSLSPLHRGEGGGTHAV
jgi:hypothetical protein